jgi:hypothetical protein
MFNNRISQCTVTSYDNNTSTESCGYIIKTKTGVRNCCQEHLNVIPGHSPYSGKCAVSAVKEEFRNRINKTHFVVKIPLLSIGTLSNPSIFLTVLNQVPSLLCNLTHKLNLIHRVCFSEGMNSNPRSKRTFSHAWCNTYKCY